MLNDMSLLLIRLQQKIMNEIKEAGWVRFKPVEGQPINDKDIKKVFKMVDMDKSGAISQLVNNDNERLILIFSSTFKIIRN